MRHRVLLSAVLISGLFAAGCGRSLVQKPNPSTEIVNPGITGSQMKVLAQVAGGDMLIDFQISATVRKVLQDSGFTVVRRAGRWDSQPEAIRAICAPGEVPNVDAVLFVWYNRLELRDCGTGSTAYEVTSGGKEGIQQLTVRLIHYLRADPMGASVDQSAAPPQ
jgi:hypothetical protein